MYIYHGSLNQPLSSVKVGFWLKKQWTQMMRTLNSVFKIWKPPDEGWIKCNVGSSWNKQKSLEGAGWILRDESGGAICHGRRAFINIYSSECAAYMALLWAMECMASMHKTNILFGSRRADIEHEPDDVEHEPDGSITEVEEDFLLCFDFTKERFGPRLPLPFHSYSGDCVTLSSVRDEQLAVLFGSDVSDFFEIWVTITVEPNYVSWSKFLQVETGTFPITGFKLESICGGSFFVDEENNVAVVFELDGYLPTTKTARQHTAFVFGEDGYFKSVNLGEAPFVEHRERVSGNLFKTCRPPLCLPFFLSSKLGASQATSAQKEESKTCLLEFVKTLSAQVKSKFLRFIVELQMKKQLRILHFEFVFMV